MEPQRGLHSSRDRGGGRPNGQLVSIKRAADGRRQRPRKMIDEEREKYRAKKGGFLGNTSTNSNGATFVILINHASGPIESKDRVQRAKQGGRPAEMSMWKRAGCQRVSKAFEKSIAARIVRESGLGLLSPSEWTEKDKELDLK